MTPITPHGGGAHTAGHTPGPWTIVNNDVPGARPLGDTGIRYLEVVPENVEDWRGAVCSCSDAEHINGVTLAERGANARLISAAPDLLATLTEILKSYEQLIDSGDCGHSDPASSHEEVIAARAAIAKAVSP